MTRAARSWGASLGRTMTRGRMRPGPGTGWTGAGPRELTTRPARGDCRLSGAGLRGWRQTAATTAGTGRFGDRLGQDRHPDQVRVAVLLEPLSGLPPLRVPGGRRAVGPAAG